MAGSYFFLPAACFATTACFFFWSALLAMACFCDDFFWLDFGDLSPITMILLCWLTCRRHISFAAGRRIIRAGAPFVNEWR